MCENFSVYKTLPRIGWTKFVLLFDLTNGKHTEFINQLLKI